jgi:Phasin protein
METRGRRAPRAAGPVGAPTEPVKPIEAPAVAAEQVAASTDAWKSTEALIDAAKPPEIEADFASTGGTLPPPPSANALPSIAKNSSPEDLAHFGRDAFAALVQSQTALARGLEAMSVEMAGLALSGIDTAARAATKMLGVKTLSDAIDVNAGFACSSLDALVGGSAKLSELGVKLATETSRPFLHSWGKASYSGA